MSAPRFRPHAVIFDCDGTLVDSERLSSEVLAACLADLGLPLDVDDAVRRFRGVRMDHTMRAIEEQFGVRLPAAFAREFRLRVAAALDTGLRPIEGAAQVLQALRRKCAVASNGPRDQVILSLRITGLAPYFGDCVFSAYDIGAFKPHPGLFLHAAASLGIEPSECLVVEDSAPGVAAAVAAGIPVVAYCAPGHEIDGAAPDARIARLEHLLDLLA